MRDVVKSHHSILGWVDQAVDLAQASVTIDVCAMYHLAKELSAELIPPSGNAPVHSVLFAMYILVSQTSCFVSLNQDETSWLSIGGHPEMLRQP